MTTRQQARASGVLGDLAPAPESQPGVTVVVCCHNSSRLLGPTLDCLSRQVVSPGIDWEVVVVDNASTDGTAAFARRVWPSHVPTSLIVVDEPRLGLAHARARGVEQARYEYLAFVDDDNWLAPAWVQALFETFQEHPDTAAVGSVIEPAFETSRPPWFALVANLYATGPAPGTEGDVTTEHVPCGAGLGVRRAALVDAQRKGFRSISVGRRGTSLAAGEDTELIYCLRLSGWRIRVEPRLRVRHFLPAARLQWSYARRLAYWSAHATAERDSLVFACKPPRSGLSLRVRHLRERWAWQCVSAAWSLLAAPLGVLKAIWPGTLEGDADVLRTELRRGRLAGLLAARAWYATRAIDVRHAAASTTKAIASQASARIGREVVRA